MSTGAMARGVAVHFTAKKHKLYQDTKHNNWVLTFVLPTEDLPAVVRDAPGGQRYTIAAVAVDDDETPKPLPAEDEKKFHGGEDGPVATTSQPDDGDAASPAAAPAKKRWHELSRAQRAGMLCEDAAFKDWFRTRYVLEPSTPFDNEMLAKMVRALCGVISRAELDKWPDPAARWDALETRFMQETGRMAVDR